MEKRERESEYWGVVGIGITPRYIHTDTFPGEEL